MPPKPTPLRKMPRTARSGESADASQLVNSLLARAEEAESEVDRIRGALLNSIRMRNAAIQILLEYAPMLDTLKRLRPRSARRWRR